MSTLEIVLLVLGVCIGLPVLIYFCSKAATLGVLRAKKLFSQQKPQQEKQQPNQ
jgi:hypothetical protein